jgi:uncharacterized membrane protein YedE/YeeE
MKNNLVALSVGFLFALGLGISGMTQPSKVIGFLDLFGAWDPSLLFVMVGAISVHSLAYRLIKNRPTPLLSTQWHLPTKKELTPSLVIGAILFGAGWGLAGYCPGPALVSVASLTPSALLFVGSMIVGMIAFKGYARL